ncbi:hypothetical protein SKAU_G00276910 [Synaphobranchus kaupii]|uniref:Uncharacterized protein n=1 Tax=Synaphobranchus kaupii TaxID=118154 RepID=A0A9Q1F1F2_SYNKA|nr:hypothetical protein SKAU_G00276910 [Synaphobranchus kaupii]
MKGDSKVTVEMTVGPEPAAATNLSISTPASQSQPTAQPSQGFEIQYPEHIQSAKARKLHKDKVLRSLPETLVSDYSGPEENRVRCNVLFYTQYPTAWHTALCQTYPHIKKNGISKGRQISILEDSDSSNAILTVNIYHTGTVMVQGTEASLGQFELGFQPLKNQAEKHKQEPEYKTLEPEPEPNSAPASEAPPPAHYTPSSPKVYSSIRTLRDSLAVLEQEFTQFREDTLANCSSHTQQANSEVASLLRQHRCEMQELRSAMRHLEEDNQALRTEHRRCSTPPHVDTHTSTLSPNTPKTSKPTGQHNEADVIILCDSNGKYLNESRLFPGRKVIKLCCPTTQTALELLSEQRLGHAKHVLIHTGTNDLSTRRIDVAKALKQVAAKATQEYPAAKVTISTLLPRTDVPQRIIHSINAEVSRGCALLPNVHLAHHRDIRHYHLYDQVHLNKEGVKMFARVLKDTALGRTSTSNYSDKRNPAIHRRPPPPPHSTQPPPAHAAQHWQRAEPAATPRPATQLRCSDSRSRKQSTWGTESDKGHAQLYML